MCVCVSVCACVCVSVPVQHTAEGQDLKLVVDVLKGVGWCPAAQTLSHCTWHVEESGTGRGRETGWRGEACYLTFIWGEERGLGKRSDGIQSCGSGDGARKACLLFSCNDCNRRSKLTVGVSAAGGVDSAAPICVAYGRFALLCESVGARLGELPVTFRGSATMSPCFPCSLSISALHNTHSLCRAGVCVATTHSRVQEFRTCIYLENKMGAGGCVNSSGDDRASLRLYLWTIYTDWLKLEESIGGVYCISMPPWKQLSVFYCSFSLHVS